MRLSCVGISGASVATTTMMEPVSSLAVGGMFGDFLADGNAGDAELIAASVVALHENADGVASGFGVEHARGRSDAAFEFVADHAGAAADVAFFDRAGVGDVEGVEGVFGVDVESVDVVEPAVPGFGDHRQRPPVTFHVWRAVFHLPGDDGVADYADAVRVGDHDRTVEKAGIFDPGGAGHLAIAVEREPGGEDGVITGLAAGMDGGDAGAHRSFADYEFAAAGDERGVADLDTLHVGDGVVRRRECRRKATPRSRARGLVWADAMRVTSEDQREDCGLQAKVR